MKFQDKLTILMDITKTTNQQLAVYSSLDSSYISRLKTGGRALVKNASYIDSFSQFFSRHIQSSTQRDVVMHLLGLDPKATLNNEKLANAIYTWFLTESKGEKLSSAQTPTNIPLPQDIIKKVDSKHLVHCNCSMYLNDEGKRLAALNFFELLAREGEPKTILLFTNEDLTWLTDDTDYSQRLFNLIKSLIIKGSKIKIIHDFNKEPYGILENIKLWMPLYITGSVEPYYYPRIRDGVYKSTLFVAPDVCAMSSNSIQDMSSANKHSTIFLFTKREAVASLEKQYESYLSPCKPLMSIFTVVDRSIYFDLFCDLENRSGATIMKTACLSATSMTEDVLSFILKRNPQEDSKEVLTSYKNRTSLLKTILMKYPLTEIFSIPSKEALDRGEVLVDHSADLSDPNISYTKEEYVQQLRNVLLMLEEYENYNVYIEEEPNDLGYSICAKEGQGVIMLKDKPPFVFLSIPNNELYTVFWNYLMEVMGHSNPDKQIAIDTIKRAIQELSS